MHRSSFAVGALVAAALVAVPAFPAGAAVTSSAAPASSARVSTPVEDPAADGRPTIGHYAAKDVRAEVRALPEGLVEALADADGPSPSEWLRQARMASDADAVADWLEARGVTVNDLAYDDGEIVIAIDDAADVALVESTGAVAEVGQRARIDLDGLVPVPAIDVDDGEGYVWEGSSNHLCSTAFLGTAADGSERMLTAGHCFEGVSTAKPVYQFQQATAGNSGGWSDIWGSYVVGSSKFGKNKDAALIDVDAEDNATGRVQVFNFGQGAPDTGTKQVIRDISRPLVGVTICKSGARTGYTCGKIYASYETINYGTSKKPLTVKAFVTGACTQPGDSGGAVYSGDIAMGVVSGTTDIYCNPTKSNVSGDYGLMFSIKQGGSKASVQTSHPGWEPTLELYPPQVTEAPAATTTTLGHVSGHAATDGAVTRVELYSNGSPTGVSTKVDATGYWYLSFADAPLGTQNLSVVTRWGKRSVSTPTSLGSVTVNPYAFSRIDGTSELSRSVAYSAGDPGDVAVIVRSSQWKQMALGLGLAQRLGGSVLLTDRGSVPSETLAALGSREPSLVILLGSKDDIAGSVASSLAEDYTVTRISGNSPLALSRAAASFDSAGSASTVYLVPSSSKPSTLAVAGAAALPGNRLLFVEAGAGKLPSSTKSTIAALAPDEVVLVGSSKQIPNGVKKTLNGMSSVGDVSRGTAPAPFRLSEKLSLQNNDPTAMFYAASSSYRDALLGAQAALAEGQLVTLIDAKKDCLPADFAYSLEIGGGASGSATLLGPSSRLSDAVGRAAVC